MKFYSALFTAGPYQLDASILSHVPSIITEEQNSALIAIPDSSKIWQAVIALDPSSAPGSNGITGHFFQSCWDIIHNEVLSAVQDFFRGGVMPRSGSVY